MMNMKRIASALLALMMVLSVLVIVPVSAADATDTSATTGASGTIGYSDSLVNVVDLTNVADIKTLTAAPTSGSYKITDVDGYGKFVEFVNTNKWTFKNVTIYLANDIDLSEVANQKTIGFWNGDWAATAANTRTTNGAAAFYGTFDGQGHSITGINLENTDATVNVAGTTGDYEQLMGFFGWVSSATIQNVKLYGTVKQNTLTGNGKAGCAALIGQAEGTVTIQNIYLGLNLTSNAGVNTAGLVARGDVASIKNCTLACNIVSNGNTGGCTSFGCAKLIENCVFTGSITSTSNGVSAFVARLRGNTTIKNCVNNGYVKASNQAEAFVGLVNSGSLTLTDCTNVGMIVGNTTENRLYPTSLTAVTVSGNKDYWTNATTFEINTAEDLVALSDLVNANPMNNLLGATVKLNADIDMTGVTMMPIGNYTDAAAYSSKGNLTQSTWFAGTFDGQDHTISNLNMSYESTQTSTVALFGFGKGATIKNLTIDANSSFIMTGKNSGYEDCAAFVARCGNVVVENCVNNAKVNSTANNTGAFCGRGGSVKNSTNNASITGVGNTGGIVGFGGVANDCTNYGEVYGGDAAGIVGVTATKNQQNGKDVTITLSGNKNYGKVTGTATAAGIIVYRMVLVELKDCLNEGEIICTNKIPRTAGELAVWNHWEEAKGNKDPGFTATDCNSLLAINYQKAATSAENATTDMRLITTVDSVDAYSKVVLTITYNGQSVDVDLTTAYESLIAGDATVLPTGAGVSTSKYILALVLTGIPSSVTSFTVQATAYDAAGNAVLQGAARTVSTVD